MSTITQHQLTATDAVGADTSAPFNLVLGNTVSQVPSSTFHSLGLVWGLTPGDDPNYNSLNPADRASVTVEYRKAGAPTWKNALNMFRQNYAWYFGTIDPYPPSQPAIEHFACSLMFLTPGTQYEIRLTYIPGLADPHQAEVRTFLAATRAIPVMPTPGTTHYVDNSWGGPFNGTDSEPYNTIQLADAAASPGDRVIIKKGSGVYTNPTPTAGLQTPGEWNNWIVYQAEDRTDPPILNGIGIEVGYLWFDNLKFVYDGPVGASYNARQSNDHWDDAAIYVISPTLPSTDYVIVTGCTMTGFLHSVHNIETGVGWVVMDNHMTGHWPVNGWIDEDTGDSNGYAFLCGGEGKQGGPNHILAYNTITRHTKAAMGGDKPGQLGTNCDAYGNKCFDTLGTPISFDGSYENNRLWGNILMQCGAFSLTLQPQKSGPWYFLYNQVALSDNQNLKWRVQDKAVVINNTFHPGNDSTAQNWTRCFSRNNLFLTEQQFPWTTTDSFPGDNNTSRESQWFVGSPSSPKVADPGWSWMGDVDYDGFDWGDGDTDIVMRWNYDAGTVRTDFRGPDPFPAFFAEIGMEEHGIRVDADRIFADNTYDPDVNLVLRSDALYNTLYGTNNPAANSGESVPNLADFHGDTNPDRGCHDRINGPPHYGQRTAELNSALHLRNEDWSIH